MTIWQALILGLVQGATEFLPISSSGHLVWVPRVLDWQPAPASFDVLVHFGTLLALVAFYRRDVMALLRACVGGMRRRGHVGAATAEDAGNRRLAWLIVVGTAPAAVVGLALEAPVEGLLTSQQIGAVGSFLVVSGALAWFVHTRSGGGKDARALSLVDAVLIGFAQACALVPGLSRSGATIAVGVACALRRDEAARFGFLLSLPAILGATVLQIDDLAALTASEVGAYVLGLAAAAASGYAAIGAVIAFLKWRVYYVFALYCAVAGASLVAWELLVR